MVTSCCAPRCTNRFSYKNGITFHRFPTDPQLREQWVRAVRRKNFHPTQATRLCGEHFTPDDFELNLYNKRCLKRRAIPSVFKFRKSKLNGETTSTIDLTTSQDALKNINSSLDTGPTPTIVPSLHTNTLPNLNSNVVTCRKVVPILNESFKINDNIVMARVAHSSSANDSYEVNDKVIISNPNPTNPNNFMVGTITKIENITADRSNIPMPLVRPRRLIYPGDFVADDMNDPQKARMMYEKCQKKIRLHKQQILTLQNRLNYKSKQIDSLKQLLLSYKKSERIALTKLLFLQNRIKNVIERKFASRPLPKFFVDLLDDVSHSGNKNSM